MSFFAQKPEYLETIAVIKNIATVHFITQKGDSIKTHAELIRIPVLGSFKSVNDEITVTYKKTNPVLTEIQTGNFLIKYRIYILVFLGIIFSAK